MSMEYGVRLKIADTVFEIISPALIPISWIEKNYKAFLCSAAADYKVFITFGKEKKGGSIFTKKGTSPRKNRSVPFSYQGNLFDISIDFPGRKAEVFAGGNSGIIGILRFVSSAVLVKNGGFLLHAASLVHDGFGYVFAGPSGSGKTTICRFSKNKTALSDETTAVVKNGKGYRVYATPFAGELGQVKKNTSARLKAIFFIHKGEDFRHACVNRACAIANLFRNCILDFADYTMTDTLFDTFCTVSQKIPGYDLYFKPEPRLWGYIDGRIN